MFDNNIHAQKDEGNKKRDSRLIIEKTIRRIIKKPLKKEIKKENLKTYIQKQDI